MGTKLHEKVRNYTYKLLILIKQGKYQAEICRQLNLPKSTVNSRIKRLEAYGFITTDIRTTCHIYKLTKKGYLYLRDYKYELSRYPRQRSIIKRLHRLNIKFPILQDNPNVKFDKEYELNNWIQKFVRLSFPISVTIKKTPKSVIAMFHQFETDRRTALTDFFNHVFRGAYYVYYYMMKKHNVIIDMGHVEMLDQHIANQRPDLQGKLDKRKTYTLDLGRKSKSFFETDLNAKAWIDRSRGLPEIETNDMFYEEKLLTMPETLHDLNNELKPTISALTQQIKLHLEVQKETLKTLKEIGGYFKK